MSRIKDYIQNLNDEDLSSHLKPGDSPEPFSDAVIAETNNKVPVMTETAVPQAEPFSGNGNVETPPEPEAINGTEREPVEVLAVDTRVPVVKEMTVVPPQTPPAKKVMPSDRKLELLSTPQALSPDPDIPSALNQVRESVVTISIDGAVGKGFICNQEGRIATSCGLINADSRIKVTLHSGDVFLGKVVSLLRDQDLAVIQIPAKTPKHLSIAATSIDVGEDIFIPNSANGAGGFIRAVINAVRVVGDATLIQFDQPIPSSDRGSPLVTEKGTVIGLVSETAARDIEDTGYAVRVEELAVLSA